MKINNTAITFATKTALASVWAISDPNWAILDPSQLVTLNSRMPAQHFLNFELLSEYVT